MSRAKTIAFFTFIGPAVAAVPILLTILVLAAFHRDVQGIGIAAAAWFLAYVYGLIPSAVSGLLFSWFVGRHPHVVHRAASVARVGAVAGFLSTLPPAAWAFLVTGKVLAYDRVLIGAVFLALGIFSGAVCAILWRRREGGGAHHRKVPVQADRIGSVLLGFLAVWTSSLPGAPGSSDVAEPAKPNLLFLVADDLATRLESQGDATVVTLPLDRLAAEGFFPTTSCGLGTNSTTTASTPPGITAPSATPAALCWRSACTAGWNAVWPDDSVVSSKGRSKVVG